MIICVGVCVGWCTRRFLGILGLQLWVYVYVYVWDGALMDSDRFCDFSWRVYRGRGGRRRRRRRRMSGSRLKSNNPTLKGGEQRTRMLIYFVSSPPLHLRPEVGTHKWYPKKVVTHRWYAKPLYCFQLITLG